MSAEINRGKKPFIIHFLVKKLSAAFPLANTTKTAFVK